MFVFGCGLLVGLGFSVILVFCVFSGVFWVFVGVFFVLEFVGLGVA